MSEASKKDTVEASPATVAGGAGLVSGVTPAGQTTPDGIKRPLVIEHRRGRKPIIIDLDVVERLASIFATDQEVAVALGMSRATLAKRKAAQGALREAMKRGRAIGRMNLRRRLSERSAKSDRVLIHMAEQHLGHKRRLQLEGGKVPIRAKIESTDDERLKRIARLAEVVMSDKALAPEMRAMIQGLSDAARGDKPKG